MDSISEYDGEESRVASRPLRTLRNDSMVSRGVPEKDVMDDLAKIWKQVLEPGLEYCQVSVPFPS